MVGYLLVCLSPSDAMDEDIKAFVPGCLGEETTQFLGQGVSQGGLEDLVVLGGDVSAVVLSFEMSQLCVQDVIIVHQRDQHVQTTQHPLGVSCELVGELVVTMHTCEQAPGSGRLLEDVDPEFESELFTMCSFSECLRPLSLHLETLNDAAVGSGVSHKAQQNQAQFEHPGK